MNSASTVSFPPRSELSLKRRVRDNDERSVLEDDLESLRTSEENLRRYEARLRALQAELEAGGIVIGPGRIQTNEPFPAPVTPRSNDAPSTSAAWDKIYRARSLLEAEQAQVRDDRLFLKESQKQLEAREKAVAAREARMDEFERRAAEIDEAPERSGVARLLFGARR